MSRFGNILLVLAVPLALALAWTGGEMRQKEETGRRLNRISPEIQGLNRISPGLYKGHVKGDPEAALFVAHADFPSYGGPLETAVVVDSEKVIRHVAVLDSNDTRSYLERVVDQAGILDHYPGCSLDDLPEVDGVSGATLSSTAIVRGVEAAARKIGAARFGLPAAGERVRKAATPETIKLVLICLFFAGAIMVSRRGFKHRARARTAMLVLSAATLGFWLGAQFSLSTVASLLSGAWLGGMASYGALLCLVLSILVFLVTKKNLFCAYICPFGAVQELLGRITGCPPPKPRKWMDWTVRAWVFAVLLAALYFQTPADAMYEPFSKAFNFVGSGIVYGLTIVVAIGALVVRRPWCNLFCPARVMFFYLRFARKTLAVCPKRTIMPKYEESNP
ncbi:MAG: FMN-binding protein [Desulfobacter sp.]|nr:MAG: FMN-binding protein [Desulfobacter sp.]